MVWSVLSPLLTLLVMRLVFTQFFGREMEHYTTYLFCSNLVFSYFNDAASQGMLDMLNGRVPPMNVDYAAYNREVIQEFEALLV